MGEYAKRRSDGEEIKIGTCEDMYYLRYDQRGAVTPLQGSVNPKGDDVYALRFRFPWPDEDTLQPGAAGYHDNGYERTIAVPGAVANPDAEHYTVQFVAQAGYVVSLPCPESGKGIDGLTIHRNGFAGAVQLVQQKLLKDGRLVPVCRCGGCGTKWRLEGPAEIEALAVAFRAEGDKRRNGAWTDSGEKVGHEFWHAIADRILLGSLIVEPAV